MDNKVYIQYAPKIDWDYSTGRLPSGNEKEWVWEESFIPIAHKLGTKVIGAHVYKRIKVGFNGVWSNPIPLQGKGVESVSTALKSSLNGASTYEVTFAFSDGSSSSGGTFEVKDGKDGKDGQDGTSAIPVNTTWFSTEIELRANASYADGQYYGRFDNQTVYKYDSSASTGIKPNDVIGNGRYVAQYSLTDEFASEVDMDALPMIQSIKGITPYLLQYWWNGVVGTLATSAQGAKADTALQPDDVGVVVQAYNSGTVIDSSYVHTDNNFSNTDKSKLDSLQNFSGDYNDLSNKPTLGTAAAQDTSAFATAAQGLLADTSLQPASIGVNVQPYSANTVIDSAYATDKARLANTSGTNTGDQDLGNVDEDISLINQHAIYFLQTPGTIADGDVRVAPTGKFEEYNAASGTWVPIGAGAGLSTYKGEWNAATNTPALASGVGVEGDYYTVSVAGSTTLDDNSAWGVEDILFFKNGTWFKIDNSVGSTLTVAGLNKQIQYNNNGVLGASSNFTFDTAVNKLYLNGVLDLPNTTSSTTGVITKNGNRFLHNFSHPTGGTAIPDGRNIFLGENAGNFTMGSTAILTYEGSYNIGLGSHTLLQLTTGYNNLAFGANSLRQLTTGNDNIAVGTNTLRGATTGNDNIAVGTNTLRGATTGSVNIAVGANSLISLTTGAYNLAIGAFSLGAILSSYNTVAIGHNAGRYTADGTTSLTNASNSLYLGDSTKASADGVSNENVFGYNAIGKGSNTVNIGNTSITDTYLNGKVHSTSSVQVADDSEVASATNVGSLRYRETANGSYTDMCMKTGASTWAWVNIKQNTW